MASTITIEDCSDGVAIYEHDGEETFSSFVTDGEGNYARIKLCVHGNPYYGLCSEYEIEGDLETLPIASDFDSHSLDCCC